MGFFICIHHHKMAKWSQPAKFDILTISVPWIISSVAHFSQFLHRFSLALFFQKLIFCISGDVLGFDLRTEFKLTNKPFLFVSLNTDVVNIYILWASSTSCPHYLITTFLLGLSMSNFFCHHFQCKTWRLSSCFIFVDVIYIHFLILSPLFWYSTFTQLFQRPSWHIK